MDKITALQLPRRAIALILAGGRGMRLNELTARRAKPAVYFGGKFRIIDFALSNCVNSGVRRIGVITQYESRSLLRHVQKGWAYLRWEMNEFVELLPAHQQQRDQHWYSGTADAVSQNLDFLRHHNSEFVIVLAGDHVYKMDYARLLQFHVDRGAQCTVGCIEVPNAEASAFGVMAIDRSHRIRDFVEKPPEPPSLPGKPGRSLASMGIYVFNTGYLIELLQKDMADAASGHDFGRDIIPEAVRMGVACAHPFSLSCVGPDPEAPYWRDVGTVDAYWSANLDLTTLVPSLDMYDRTWPIWTYQEQLPPAKFVFDQDDRRGMAVESIVSGGCVISGSRVARSVLFSKCRVNSYCTVEGAVLLPDVDVARHARLRNVVVDRGCRIPEGLVVGEDPAADAARFFRTEHGVTLVTQDMLDRLVQARA